MHSSKVFKINHGKIRILLLCIREYSILKLGKFNNVMLNKLQQIK